MGVLILFPQATSQSDLSQGFYPPADAARLARISRANLDAWRRKKLVMPSSTLSVDGRTQVGYSFVDVVFLRVLRVFREHRVTLDRAARAVAEHLVERFGLPGPAWHDARIYLTTIKGAREVVVESKDEWERSVATMGGQKLSSLLFGDDLHEMVTRADALLVPAEFRSHVIIDPTAKSGMPLIKDTGVTTRAIYALKQRGQRYADIESAYPFLTLPQIRTAVRFERMLDAA